MARRTRITFETSTAHAVEHRGKPLPIVVEIQGDKLTFRHKGHRTRYDVAIADAMRLAIVHTPRID